MDLSQGHLKGLLMTWTPGSTCSEKGLSCYLPQTFLHHAPQTWEILLWSIFKEACCVLMKYFSGFKCYFV